MKSKVFGGFLVLLAICMLSHTLLACSEKVASGGTVDENTIAENDIKEHHVDSTKVFAEAEPSDVGNHKIDSVAYWYEIHFHSERENYFTHEEDDSYLDPYLYCYINIYRFELGVQSQISVQNVGEFGRTFFLTLDDKGFVSHEKLDNIYFDKARCEKDLSDFGTSCENEGGVLYRHWIKCDENGLHLTCASSKGSLAGDTDEILKDFAEKMKNWCLEK